MTRQTPRKGFRLFLLNSSTILKIVVLAVLATELTGCRGSAEKKFTRGCEKMFTHFDSERKRLNLGKIDDSQSCTNRIEKKKESLGAYFEKLKGYPEDVQEGAGCGFAVSSYASIYHQDFSFKAPPPLTTSDMLVLFGSSTDESLVKVSNKYCNLIGITVKGI